jgi:hypothetical protein
VTHDQKILGAFDRVEKLDELNRAAAPASADADAAADTSPEVRP